MCTFNEGSVPVAVAARVYGKDATWIRAGIIGGWLPIGTATRNGKRIENVNEINSKSKRKNVKCDGCKYLEKTRWFGITRRRCTC